MELSGGSEYAEDGWNGNESYKNQWANATSVEEAAIAFQNGFERPSIPHQERRIQWANTYYEMYQGTVVQGSEEENSDQKDLQGILFIGY